MLASITELFVTITIFVTGSRHLAQRPAIAAGGRSAERASSRQGHVPNASARGYELRTSSNRAAPWSESARRQTKTRRLVGEGPLPLWQPIIPKSRRRCRRASAGLALPQSTDAGSTDTRGPIEFAVSMICCLAPLSLARPACRTPTQPHAAAHPTMPHHTAATLTRSTRATDRPKYQPLPPASAQVPSPNLHYPKHIPSPPACPSAGVMNSSATTSIPSSSPMHTMRSTRTPCTIDARMHSERQGSTRVVQIDCRRLTE